MNFIPRLGERVRTWEDFVAAVLSGADAVEQPPEPEKWPRLRHIDEDAALQNALVAFVNENPLWQGTATELFQALAKRVVNPPDDWPSTPNALGFAMRRSAETLHTMGIAVGFDGEFGAMCTRIIRLKRLKRQ